MGTYIKKDANGVSHLYSGKLRRCGPTIEFEKPSYSISEDINDIGHKKYVETRVILSSPLTEDMTIKYTTRDGTATVADGDYVEHDHDTLTIPAGETNVSLPIAIYNDAAIELDEYFFVYLSDPSNPNVHVGDINETRIDILEQTDSPVCFEDNFDDGVLDDKWRVLQSSGGFIPKIVKVGNDGRLRITENAGNIATTITKDYKFTTSENLIIVEFDYYAYGGCGSSHGGLGTYGADGIVNVLFDSSVGSEPMPGSFGGSMGYAQRNNGDAGFEGGWLGLGIDEYGNFGNCNEGRIGGLPNTSCDNGSGFNPQEHTNTAVIRGDGQGTHGYEFLEGVELMKSPLNQSEVARKNATDYFSGKYKMTVDARNSQHLYIRLERDEGSGYQVIIPQFDGKDPQYNQGTTPNEVRYAITGGTGGGCNNHEISWIRVKGNCAVYGALPSTGSFDGWDTDRDDENTPPSDRNISTKIVSEPFNLSLASLSTDQTLYMTKPVAARGNNVEAAIYEKNGLIPISENIKEFDAGETAHIHEASFTVNKAYKDAVLGFKICATNEHNATTNEDSFTLWPTANCNDNAQILLCDANNPDTPQWHICYSSDNFAIRPKNFEISTPDLDAYKAGLGYPFTYYAKDNNNTAAVNYNESEDGSFEVVTAIKDESKTGCINNSIERNVSINFHDGIDNNITYLNTVGDFNMTIQEINGSEFALVDEDDTPLNNRLIEPATVELLHIVPSDFKMTPTFNDHHTSGAVPFTYVSRVSSLQHTMAANLDVSIEAIIADGTTAENYNVDCYADDTKFVIDYNLSEITPVNALINIQLYEETADKEVSENLPQTPAFNQEIPISFESDLFETSDPGKADIHVNINFDRTMNIPVNPFILSINDINLTETDDEVSSEKMINQDAHYLYARAKSSKFFYDDVSTNNVNTPIKVEVYCNKWPTTPGNCPNVDIVNGRTNDYRWFLSTAHDTTVNDGNISLAIGNISVAGGQAAIAGASPVAITAGDGGINPNVNVTRNAGGLPMTVEIDFAAATNNWLIYNKYSNAAPNPFYKVRFIGNMDWAGYGKTGHVVDSNSSIKKNRRLGW
jgi:hypothetical protein